jgi:hypothetical protein
VSGGGGADFLPADQNDKEEKYANDRQENVLLHCYKIISFILKYFGCQTSCRYSSLADSGHGVVFVVCMFLSQVLV